MTVIDIGTRWGSMTLQMLSAIEFTRVMSIDIEKTIHGGAQPVGKFIPTKYKYEQLTVDVTKWIAATGEQANLIFEDTAHNQETTYRIYKHAKRVLSPGGVIISHDAVHPKFKGAVVAGIKQAGINSNVYLVEGDSCGLAIWQKPKIKLSVENWQSEEIQHEAKIDNEAVKETPKRRRRKKASKIKKNIEEGKLLVKPQVTNLIQEIEAYTWQPADGKFTEGCKSCDDIVDYIDVMSDIKEYAKQIGIRPIAEAFTDNEIEDV